MYKLALALPLALVVAAQTGFTPHRPLAAAKPPCQFSGIPHEDSVMSGNVAVRRASNGNIVVIVDRASATKTPDGTPDLVYRFAPLKEDISRYSGVSFNLKRAQVYFQSGRLAVVSKDNRVMVGLSVEQTEKDDARFPTYGDRSRDLPNTVRLNQGIGLVRQLPNLSADPMNPAGAGKAAKISLLPSLVDLEADFVIRKGGARTMDDGVGGGCTSGGKGATECGIGCPGGNGCSITCGVGYWACCNCPNSGQCTEKTDLIK